MSAFMGDYSAEEQTVLIAKRIARDEDALLSYPTDIKALAEGGDYHKALTKLIDESHRLFDDRNSSDDVLSSFKCISLLLCSKLDASLIPKVALHLAVKVRNDDVRAPLKLRILSDLFNNLAADSITRYEMYVHIIEFAVKTGELKLMNPSVEQVDQWLKVWGGGVTVAQARAMYRAIAEGLTGVDAQKFMYKFLETYNSETDAGLNAVKNEAMHLMMVTMRDPECFQLDFLTKLAAIQHLKSTPEFALFDIYLRGSANDLKAFNESNPGVVEKMGLNKEGVMRKLKYLTLVSLCTGKSEVAYDEIRREIDVEEDELELFIIDAISTKVIEAKMDQMRQVLLVQYVMRRSFQVKDWDTIEERLLKFRAGLLEVISLRKRSI